VSLGAASFGADALTHGVILGLVYGVLAAGLVLIYRASGVVNFAHGEAGALGAAVLAKLVLDEHWPFAAALPVVLVLGGAIGAASEILIVRRLAHRPRLALLVATIGLSQVLLVAQLLLPKINEVAAYPTPLHRQLTIGPVTLTGPDFVAIAAVPAIIVGLAIWLARTPSGRALRAASDNPDAARLAGIRPHRVALMAWVLAGIVSTATAVIANPLQGVTVGQPTESIGVGLLVRALVAALVGRLQSLTLAIAGGVAVGVVQAVADSGHISQSAVDLVLLLAALALVLARPSERSARTRPGEGELVTVPPARQGRALAITLLIGAAALPLVAGRSSELFSLTRVVLYAVVGVSVVILTGWAGQLSLGQFAVVGIGTFAAASLEQHGVPFWVGVPLAGAVGAGISLLVGVPALRARGLDLAVTTLALAVACSSWLFTQSWLLGPGGVVVVQRGRLLGIDLRGPLAYYEACVVVLGAALLGATALRGGGLGRRLLAVRAHERRAAALGVSPTVTKLAAFVLAGALAGIAGALLAGLRVRSGAADFGPQESLEVVALAVIGGAGSAEGAVLGAVFVLGVPAIFGDTTVAGLLPSGLGLLVLVLLFPGGLLELVRRLLPRRPSQDRPRETSQDRPRETPQDRPRVTPEARPHHRSPPAALSVTGLTVRFGGRIALDNVDVVAPAGQVLGVIGANGAGKSTLLDVVSGFVRPASGTVVVGGRPMGRMSPAARAHAGVGRVLQDARLFEDLTLLEAVLVGTPGRGRPRRAAAGAVLDLLGLRDAADLPCQELSMGMRRLAELACAVSAGPSLLLLDEPTAGLAQPEAEAFTPLLGHLGEELGTTVVVVEHDVALVAAVATSLVCLDAGQVIAAGAVTEVLADARVVESFLGAPAPPD